jgi:hypothetical protein
MQEIKCIVDPLIQVMLVRRHIVLVRRHISQTCNVLIIPDGNPSNPKEANLLVACKL